MRLEKSRNAKFNIIWGTANNAVEIITPFVCKTVILHVLSSEMLGLDSLYVSLLSVINIAEMGFASATAFSMYKPIAQTDYESIRRILNYLKHIYRIVGLAILLIGLLLLPFIPYFIKDSSYPQGENIYVLFLLYLCDSVAGYVAMGHWTVVLNAFQSNGYVSIVKFVLNIIKTFMQVILLLNFKKYIMYVLIIPITTIITNILCFFICRRKYPEVICDGKIDKDEKSDIVQRVKGLLVYKVCNLSRNTFDGIFISAFLGLSVNAYYTGYFAVHAALSKMMSVISESLVSGVGNSMNLDSVEKNYNEMNIINYIYMLIGGWISICMLCLYQPFILLWLGKEALFDFSIPLAIVLYFYVSKMGDIRALYSDAAGLWWENRFRSIIEAITNIVLNYCLIKTLGVLGIILASLVSLLFIGFPWSTKVLFDKYFLHYSIKAFFLDHMKYFTVSSIIAMISYGLCSIFQSSIIEVLAYRCLICLFIPPLLYWIFYRNYVYYGEVKKWIIKWIR